MTSFEKQYDEKVLNRGFDSRMKDIGESKYPIFSDIGNNKNNKTNIKKNLRILNECKRKRKIVC